MKLDDFKKGMRKSVFSLEEAKRVAWETSEETLRLQLHLWVKTGALIRLKRGVYGFPESLQDKIEVARALYGPAYVSLEYALQNYGLLPDAVFAITLVTSKVTRRFHTPVGSFFYHKIKADLFWGYDPQTLLGEREKVLVDYCYFHSGHFVPDDKFWDTLRWQHLETVHFKKALTYARRTGVKKVVQLIQSLESYGKAQKNH